jgi:threonine dehydratase
MLTITDIDRAHSLIAGHVRQTPVILAEGAMLGLREPVCLKLEMLQHAGSFKPRGAFNRILGAAASGPLPADGVIAASGGNHGLAVAHVAQQLGIPARIFVPEAASAVKVARIRALGATVTVTGAMYADAYDACLRHAESSGALFVHAYDQPEVVAGQGTVGRELMAQADVDTVLLAVGGGGLAAGVRIGIGPDVKLVAVEPERIPTLRAALDAGRPVDVEVGGVAADALGARRIGSLAFEILTSGQAHGSHRVPGSQLAHRVLVTDSVLVTESVPVTESVLVTESAIVRTRQRLWDRLQLAAEPAGATAAAALLSGAYVPEPGERVAVIICGANTDPSDLESGGQVTVGPPAQPSKGTAGDARPASQDLLT